MNISFKAFIPRIVSDNNVESAHQKRAIHCMCDAIQNNPAQ